MTIDNLWDKESIYLKDIVKILSSICKELHAQNALKQQELYLLQGLNVDGRPLEKEERSKDNGTQESELQRLPE